MSNVRRYEPERRFDRRADGTRAFDGVLPRAIRTPDGVVEHVIQAGDRPDALAHHYYDDTRLWFRILDANPQLECGADISDPARVGHVIVIPAPPAPGAAS